MKQERLRHCTFPYQLLANQLADQLLAIIYLTCAISVCLRTLKQEDEDEEGFIPDKETIRLAKMNRERLRHCTFPNQLLAIKMSACVP